MILFVVISVLSLLLCIVLFNYRALKSEKKNIQNILEIVEDLFSQKIVSIQVWYKKSSKSESKINVGNHDSIPKNWLDYKDFLNWQLEKDAQIFSKNCETLFKRNRSFQFVLETKNQKKFVVSGRFYRRCHVIYWKVYTHDLNGEIEKNIFPTQSSFQITVQKLLFNLQIPIWIRNDNGNLIWINQAYSDHCRLQNKENFSEIFGENVRQPVSNFSKNSVQMFDKKVMTVLNGDRYIFRIFSLSQLGYELGAAVDISSYERLQNELDEIKKGQVEILDQLSTAVAIFDHRMILRFYNHSFSNLWNLDIAFLDSSPSQMSVLEKLQESTGIENHTEWRQWKDLMLSTYRSIEPLEQIWHLIDRRILRVVVRPYAQGGVIWFFENLTEKVELEIRYNTLMKVQGETLDHLSEGIVVFGTDGKLRLANPAFIQLWGLPPQLSIENIHVSKIAEYCEKKFKSTIWKDLSEKAVGFADVREEKKGRIELRNDLVFDYGIVPLPNGQTLFTFMNVTDSVCVERALKEKNEALKLVDQLRNDFVQHVSYELRSPLTNIIGFTEILQNFSLGDLSEKQKEYLDYISSCSNQLLVIVNDILDLARVDAGIMELHVKNISIANVIKNTLERVKNRMQEKMLKIVCVGCDDEIFFEADPARLHQIFLHLLNNAITYAPFATTIKMSVLKTDSTISFSIQDEGSGILDLLKKDIFKRFQAYGKKKGVGLGLSIVKSFVELHGGSIIVDPHVTYGAKFICTFPLRQSTHPNKNLFTVLKEDINDRAFFER